MSKGKLDPDALIVDRNNCEIGVGELCNVGTTGVRLLMVNPNGKRAIEVEDAKTYRGVIPKEFALWLSERYQVILQEVTNDSYIIKSPYALQNSD